MLRGDHVVVVILRKMSVHAVTGLAGFSVADVVRQNDVVTSDIKKLSGPEEDAGELRRKELRAGAAGAVQEQNGIRNVAVRVAHGRPKGRIVHAQLR